MFNRPNLRPTQLITSYDRQLRSQWSSGSMLAYCARGPRFKSHWRQKFAFSRKSLRYAALGTGCTLTAVPRSTQPSTLRGTVNKYQPYGLVLIPMEMGECSAYSSLQEDSKLGLRVGGHLALTDFSPEEPQWTLAYGWRRRWQHYKYRRGLLLLFTDINSRLWH